jgi:hypothetical protein
VTLGKHLSRSGTSVLSSFGRTCGGVRPECEGGVTHHADPSEHHAGHGYVDDELRERLGGPLDQLSQR